MQEYIPIQIDKSHLSTIGERMYSHSLDLIRELVANAYDADATIVKIKTDESSIVVEDNGSGMDKDGLRQYLTIGSPFKREHQLTPKFKRIRIGEFGIGKFAVLSICDRFEIYTKSDSYAATLLFNRRDFENRQDWNIPIIQHSISNEDNGTRVSLFAINKPISLFDIERHITHIFPLNDKKFSIYLNDLKVQSKYIPGERFKIKETTEFGQIKGEVILSSLILPKETVGIGIRVKGILIKRETFDIENSHSISVKRLTGEINTDFLPITASRDDFIIDSKEYQIFERIMKKKLNRVVKTLKQSAMSYQDKKAEQVLSEALITIREALKRHNDILLLESLPLFAKQKGKFAESEKLQRGVISTSLTSTSHKDKIEKDEIREALRKIKPKVRSRIKTLLKDEHRIVKKVKIGGSEFLVSFTHLGNEEKESFTEGGIIYINRDHPLFTKMEGKSELTLYHLIRLVTQEIIKLADPRNLEAAFDWQGKLIRDAFTATGPK
jgi:HSP90 family molecular chaperone